MDTPQRVRPKPKDKMQSPLSSSLADPMQSNVIDSNTLKNDFINIMQGIQQLPKPDKTQPVACFSKLSFPILIAPLALDSGDSTGVNLPVIGISRFEKGRAVAFGNTRILLECNRENTDASAFLENIIKWASGVIRGYISVLIVGFQDKEAEVITKNATGFGFRIVVQKDLENIQHHHVVIVPSDFDDPEYTLLQFIQNGGGLICTLQPPTPGVEQERYRMNSILTECGLGFPSTNLLAGPVNAPQLKVNFHLSALGKLTFPGLSQSLSETLNNPVIDITELDSGVTAVRYNVSCMPQDTNPELVQLAASALGYLRSHNFDTPEGLCPDISHGVISVLLCEIMAKLSAQDFAGHDFSERFPERASEEPSEQDVGTVRLTLQNEGWYSTGYWLTAGVVAKITLNEVPPVPLVVQVGMHAEAIFTKEGPWKRWPMITTTFELDEVTEIANPFGGMIYIIFDRSVNTPITIDMTIDHVFPYPLYSPEAPDTWEKTKDRGAPWAEVEAYYMTFVAPSKVVRACPNLEANCKMIDGLIESVLEFLGDHSEHKFRCIFDIELIDMPVCGYPIIMHVDNAESFFSDTNPSESLFVLTTFVGMLSLPEGAFDAGKESSLACAAACAAFLKMWPRVSPLDYSRDMLPPQFNELWNIYKKDNGRTITAAMISIRQMEFKDNEDVWATFISEIQMQTGLSLDHLISNQNEVKAQSSLAVVSSTSSASLQSFQLIE